jgi:hypothetical protein
LITIYLDGEFLTSDDNDHVGDVTGDYAFVGGARSGGAIGSFFSGHIDDLRVWHGLLTADDVEKLHRNRFTNRTDGLVC